MRHSTHWRWLAADLALGAILIGSGCTSLGTQPDKAATTMAGDWRVDAASSDDFERKLIPLLQQARRHDMPRGMPGGQEGGGVTTSPAQIAPVVAPPEDPEKLHSRIGDDLRPAAELRIALVGDAVQITRDSDPVREFQPGQTVSRIDTSGAASVDSGWDQGAFVIRARYTTRGTRNWRLEHDSASDTLRVKFEANNPEFGHLELHTLYRRASGSPAG